MKAIRITQDKLNKLILDLNNKPFYFFASNEDATIKVTSSGKYVKFKGKDPFLAMRESNLVLDVFIEPYQITENEYEDY